MTPDNLVAELETRGITLRRSGDRVMVRDPNRALTPGLKQLIARHKRALLSKLNVPDDVSQLSLVSAMSAESVAPTRLQVETWPADPARDRLMWHLLSDPRCANFYAADRDLCEALDDGNVTTIAAAQARFARALIHARHLATEIQGAAERIGERAMENTPLHSKPS